MANNPYVNKVVFGSATLVDLTGTTATADKILEGYGAFGADGAWMDGTATASSGSGVVWQDSQGYVHLSDEGDIPLQTKTVTPSETAQTITPDNGYYALDKVNVGAISSSYVGSGITRRSSSDLAASGATVTVPSGYYSAQASKSVASGTAGTPTATKGTVSNHSISVTPSVTNTTGYITGGTKNGTAVTVSASELVSGTYSVTSSGTKDVTNYASASVPSGTAGTPTASKGTVSNHSISVTPSVTNTTGYISGGTKTGTAVTVTASELVSGSQTVTSNQTVDVTNLAELVVNVSSPAPTIQSLSVTPSETAQTFNASGVDGYKPVSVSAVSSTYVGTGITRRSATDMSGAYDKDVGSYQVSAPAGYYSSESQFTVPNGTIETPTATKGTVSNHSVSITPSVFHHPGYIHGGIEEGTAVTVSASELVSGTKSITENGTGIDVTNYANVNVNVSGGGGGTSNFVTGTFTGTTAGAAMNVTIPYSGSGYPILVAIEPTGGVRGNSGFFTAVQRYATAQYFLYKGVTTTTPTYTGNGNENGYIPTNVYKSSSTNYESLSRNGSTGAILASSSSTATSGSNGSLVYLHSATEMSVFIANTSYGFKANTEYTYRILYSS